MYEKGIVQTNDKKFHSNGYSYINYVLHSYLTKYTGSFINTVFVEFGSVGIHPKRIET
jgi:hypothetical protein